MSLDPSCFGCTVLISGSARAVFPTFCFHSKLLKLVFLDSACYFLMMEMVQTLRLVVISVPLPIVELLELVAGPDWLDTLDLPVASRGGHGQLVWWSHESSSWA